MRSWFLVGAYKHFGRKLCFLLQGKVMYPGDEASTFLQGRCKKYVSYGMLPRMHKHTRRHILEDEFLYTRLWESQILYFPVWFQKEFFIVQRNPSLTKRASKGNLSSAKSFYSRENPNFKVPVWNGTCLQRKKSVLCGFVIGRFRSMIRTVFKCEPSNTTQGFWKWFMMVLLLVSLYLPLTKSL